MENERTKIPYDKPIVAARLIERHNRFVASCELDGEIVGVHVPNTGRMVELVVPQNRVWLADHGPDSARRFRYGMAAADLRGHPVLVDSSRTNRVVATLIDAGAIADFVGYRVARREVKLGNSRIDLLLQHEESGEELYLEVKSCTFVKNGLAMFPDAPSDRATRHLEELAQSGKNAAVLFCIQLPDAHRFTPLFHVDPAFSERLLALSGTLRLVACGLVVDSELAVECRTLPVTIDLEIARTHNRDGGAYALIIEVDKELELPIGALGQRHFAPGFYVYIGSARRNLGARVKRHQRKKKTLRWHIDYLLPHAKLRQTLTIRGYGDELKLAGQLTPLAQSAVAGFGASDSRLASHLFYFARTPYHSRGFVEWLMDAYTGVPEADG